MRRPALRQVHLDLQDSTWLGNRITKVSVHSQRLPSTAAQTEAASTRESKTAALPKSFARLDSSWWSKEIRSFAELEGHVKGKR